MTQILIGLIVILLMIIILLLKQRRQALSVDTLLVVPWLDECSAVMNLLQHPASTARIVRVDKNATITIVAASANDPYPQMTVQDLCTGARDSLLLASKDQRRSIHSCDLGCGEGDAHLPEWWCVVPLVHPMGSSASRLILSVVGNDEEPPQTVHDNVVAVSSRLARNLSLSLAYAQARRARLGRWSLT